MRLNCINLVSTEPERLRSFYAMTAVGWSLRWRMWTRSTGG